MPEAHELAWARASWSFVQSRREVETINACANLLYCPGKYAKQDGHVVCE